MVLPYNWNLFGRTFSWCYIFLRIFQNEIWIFVNFFNLVTSSSWSIKEGYVVHCVIPENIYTPHPLVGKGNSNGRGVQREAISEGVGACLLRFFFSPGVWLRLVSYQQLTASLLSMLSVILIPGGEGGRMKSKSAL